MTKEDLDQERICKYCGLSFAPKSSNQKYCAKDCQQAAYVEKAGKK